MGSCCCKRHVLNAAKSCHEKRCYGQQQQYFIAWFEGFFLCKCFRAEVEAQAHMESEEGKGMGKQCSHMERCQDGLQLLALSL